MRLFWRAKDANLPKQYAWLGHESMSNHLVQVLKLYGTVETPGAKNNMVILGWAKEVAGDDVYVAIPRRSAAYSRPSW